LIVGIITGGPTEYDWTDKGPEGERDKKAIDIAREN